MARKCRFCAEDIKDAATVCPHCNRDLIPGRTTKPTDVHVRSVDAFGSLHAPIQGRSAGSITVVGYMGIGLGVLMCLLGIVMLPSATDGGRGSFMLVMFGIGTITASSLWARR